MAHTDACKIQVCQFVKKCADNGMSINKACQEAERESEGIPAETIRRWWKESLTEELVKIDQQEPTTCNNEGIEEKQRNQTVTSQSLENTHTPGPGRPPKHRPMMANYPNPAEIISPAFKSAYDLFFDEVARAKTSGWKSTEKKVVLQYIQYLNDLATY